MPGSRRPGQLLQVAAAVRTAVQTRRAVTLLAEVTISWLLVQRRYHFGRVATLAVRATWTTVSHGDLPGWRLVPSGMSPFARKDSNLHRAGSRPADLPLVYSRVSARGIEPRQPAFQTGALPTELYRLATAPLRALVLLFFFKLCLPLGDSHDTATATP